MVLFRGLFAGAALAALALTGAAAQAGTIFTEDFSGAIPGGGSGPGGAYGGAIPGTQISVTTDNVDLLGVLNGTNFNCVDNPAGNCLDLVGNQGGGGIESVPTFNLVAGDTYTVAFGANLQGDFGGNTPTTTFDVGLGTLSQSETLAAAVNTAYTLTFKPVVDETGAELTFTTVTGADGVHGAVIDNISLAQSAPVSDLPEPASWALMLFGIAVVGGAARVSRRTQVATAG
ncbi:MAG TPA: PEPxxWA-CTERM sorting domain-containing protein [Caulobacteraceae bacterium]|jgi:hypothetical protein